MRMTLANSVAFAIILMMIAVVFAEAFRKRVAGWFFASRNRLWLLPTIILFLYFVITFLIGRWQLQGFLILGLYFCIPVFLIWINAIRISVVGVMDAVFVLSVWFPQEFGLIDIHWISIHGFPLPLGKIATVIYLLILLTGQSSIELQCPGSMRVPDLVTVGIAYVGLFAIIVPLGMSVKFVMPGFNRGIIGSHETLILLFLGIFFTVAVPEELLFRGWIQNLLMRRLEFVPGLLSAAIIFGLSHLDNKVVTSTHTFDIPNWWYAFFATFAGLAYGYVYQRRKSLFASALLHALLDFTWVAAFAG
jgi:membrane protease YdiL (CAAX protease family)